MVTALMWDGPKAFAEHVERMRVFRQSHTGDPETRLALLESMPTLYVIRPVREVGGSRALIGAAGWSALIPAWAVAFGGFSQN